MGTSYDGIYFFGCTAEGEDADESWGAETMATFEAAGSDDFGAWVDAFLGVGSWREYPDYAAYKAEQTRRMTERWGCAMASEGWLGFLDYHANAVHPEGARLCEWRGARVPEWSAEQIDHWRACMERLRDDLPGLSAPGLWFGCQVG